MNEPLLSTKRSPQIASVLSLIVPGLGQGYNAERSKGAAIFTACVLLGSSAVWLSGLNRITIVLAVVLLWLSSVVDAWKTAASSGQVLDWYYRRSYVITMLLLVGPLALPLLWQSSYFSRFARWMWSTVVVGVALLFLVTPYFLRWLVRRIPELEATLRIAGIEL